MNNFDTLAIFDKEFKRLSKKYQTLYDDLEKFKKILVIYPTGIGKNFTIIRSNQFMKIVKARLACQTLRNRALRIIYAYFIQKQKIEFIELYSKSEKNKENYGRINEYLNCYV